MITLVYTLLGIVLLTVTPSPAPPQGGGSTASPLPQGGGSTASPLPLGGGAGGGGLIEFTPQYPLWSDGMDKRRWLQLPAGTAIDKSDADRWEFPRGTQAWKEFSRDARRVETRHIERLPDGSWSYRTYAWNADGTHATLAPEDGIPERGIPSRADCVACHEGAPSPILGYSAVQLTARLEPALGYLHGNCGHCHNSEALPALGLELLQRVTNPEASAAATRASLIGRSSRFRPHGAATTDRARILITRMKSRDPLTRMPPIGVEIADTAGIAVIERWLEQLNPAPEKTP